VRSSDPLWSQLRSGISGIEWPPALRGPAAALETLVRQFEESEWRDPAAIADAQFRQLRRLAAHAGINSSHFAARLHKAGLRGSELGTMDALRTLPLLTRRELQSPSGDVHCREVPSDHLPIHENRTSGSAGEPVIVKRTAVCRLFWLANTMREYFWHERDFSLRFTAIGLQFHNHVVRQDWGEPANLLFATGASQLIPASTDIAQQVAWLAEFDPHVLVAYPIVLDAVLHYCATHDVRLPHLKLIRSISGALPPRLREEARALFGAKLVDNYSSEEVGIIAVECPDGDGYHVMSESVIVEILDEHNAPAPPGETGRVVITDLHNFATPLIRYEIGDYAEAGAICSCGRGLPTLKRIAGRQRNWVRMPHGKRFYPRLGYTKLRDIAPVQQYQIVQHDLQRVEARLVTERPLTAEEVANLRTYIHHALGHPFDVTFSYFLDRLPRVANGKFEEFVCLVP